MTCLTTSLTRQKGGRTGLGSRPDHRSTSRSKPASDMPAEWCRTDVLAAVPDRLHVNLRILIFAAFSRRVDASAVASARVHAFADGITIA